MPFPISTPPSSSIQGRPLFSSEPPVLAPCDDVAASRGQKGWIDDRSCLANNPRREVAEMKSRRWRGLCFWRIYVNQLGRMGTILNYEVVLRELARGNLRELAPPKSWSDLAPLPTPFNLCCSMALWTIVAVRFRFGGCRKAIVILSDTKHGFFGFRTVDAVCKQTKLLRPPLPVRGTVVRIGSHPKGSASERIDLTHTRCQYPDIRSPVPDTKYRGGPYSTSFGLKAVRGGGFPASFSKTSKG